MATPHVLKYHDPEFDLWTNTYEPSPGHVMTFVHFVAGRWSLGVLKRCLAAWPTKRASLPTILFACGEHDDSKWERFVRTFGFHPLTDCTDGTVRRIFVNYR